MTTLQRATPTVATVTHAERGDRLLIRAAALFTVAVLVHGADHVRRGVDSVGLDVFWLGTSAVALEVGVVALACQRHRLAPLAATVIGFSLTFGYLVVHFLPERAWLSDSFISATGVSGLSWAAASFEVVAALAFGLAGLQVVRSRGGLVSATHSVPGQRGLRQGITHPLALAMIVGNVAILAVSATQLV